MIGTYANTKAELNIAQLRLNELMTEKEVLYTKYNSRRKPVFQLSTSIIEVDGKRFAQKKAIQARANEHLRNMVSNRTKLESLYQDIVLVDCIEEEDGLLFPFVKGKHLLSDVLVKNDSLEGIIADIEAALKKVSTYKEAASCEFEMTERFAEVFKETWVDIFINVTST